MNNEKLLSKAMSILGSRRWEKFTPDQKREHIAKMCKGRIDKLKEAKLIKSSDKDI